MYQFAAVRSNTNIKNFIQLLQFKRDQIVAVTVFLKLRIMKLKLKSHVISFVSTLNLVEHNVSSS